VKGPVIALFSAFALAGCVAVPAGPAPPLVVPGPALFERYPNGYYVTPDGHYYHRDEGERWHYGRDHQEGLREEEHRRQEEDRRR
jgi:hypothetical protein